MLMLMLLLLLLLPLLLPLEPPRGPVAAPGRCWLRAARPMPPTPMPTPMPARRSTPKQTAAAAASGRAKSPPRPPSHWRQEVQMHCCWQARRNTLLKRSIDRCVLWLCNERTRASLSRGSVGESVRRPGEREGRVFAGVGLVGERASLVLLSPAKRPALPFVASLPHTPTHTSEQSSSSSSIL